jgi:hypothetical protein
MGSSTARNAERTFRITTADESGIQGEDNNVDGDSQGCKKGKWKQTRAGGGQEQAEAEPKAKQHRKSKGRRQCTLLDSINFKTFNFDHPNIHTMIFDDSMHSPMISSQFHKQGK